MMMEAKRFWAPRWTGACLMAALAAALLVPVQRASAATCNTCPSDTNAPIRLSASGEVLPFGTDEEKDAKKAACPQFVNGAIDVANTDPNNPLDFPMFGGGTQEVLNPYWDLLATSRASGKTMADANVNIMELFTCDDALCGNSHGGFPSPAHPPLEKDGVQKCENDFTTISQPGTVYGKKDRLLRVYVRQRCLLQQKLDQNGNPVVDKDGNALTAPLCVRGYQVWLRYDANLLEIDSIVSAPTVADGSCITRNSPYTQGIAGFSIVEADGQGLAFAAAGIADNACPTADDAVIACFTFKVKGGDGDANVRFAEDHISANISDFDVFTTPATQWTKDAAGTPVLPNLQNKVRVVVDNTAPVFVAGVSPAKCTLKSPLVVECGRGNAKFGNDYRTDVSPDTMISLDNVTASQVVPLLVAPSPVGLDAPACLTFTDTIIPLCGFQFDVKRVWTATDCAGNSNSCEVQVIQVRDRTDPESRGPVLEISCLGDIPAPMGTDMDGDFALNPMEFSMIGMQVNGKLVTGGILWDRCGQVFARFAGDFRQTETTTGQDGTIINRTPVESSRINSTSLDVCDQGFCPATIWRLYIAEDVCEKQQANVWMQITIVRKDRPTLISGSWVKNIDTFADALTLADAASRNFLCSASVDINLISPRAMDECGCVLSRESGLGTFDGLRSDNSSLPSSLTLDQKLNLPYPEGCTTITWTIKDCDENELFVTGTPFKSDGSVDSSDPLDKFRLKTTVCVEPFNIVVADIEYGIASRDDLPALADFKRCITMELTGCADSTSTVEQETLMTFKDVGSRLVPVDACAKDKPSRTVKVYAAVEAKFLVPCGIYDCATARDILHTLATKNDASDRIAFGVDKSVKPWRYKANFNGVRSDEESYCTAKPFKHDDDELKLIGAVSGAGGKGQFTNRNRLLVGNLNDDSFIDIDDFGIFSASFGRMVAADTCLTKPFHADLVPDGVIELLDFGTIATNFLRVSERPCCVSSAVASATAGPRASVTVAQLREEGKAALAAGDLNGDGVLDVADMEAFAAGVRPVRLAGDLDLDGDVDMADYMAFQACFTGSGDTSGLNCLDADLNGDGDVDLSDLVEFQTRFTGSQ